ncbi:hypothetical protein EV426DRAFT_670283 [Tirmania nivea]|nr:hypothetical protein EV426DRAFT_670283 [Tirmania nivea]
MAIRDHAAAARISTRELSVTSIKLYDYIYNTSTSPRHSMSKITRGYPWEEYKEEIRRLYIGNNCNLRMLKEHLQNLDSPFCPSDRAIKIHLRRWGFSKNGKHSISLHPLSRGARLPSSLPESTSVVSFSRGPSEEPVAGAQVATCKDNYTSQIPISAKGNTCGTGNQQLHIKQAGAAILILRSAIEFQRNLRLFQEGVQNDLFVPGQDLPLLLDRTCIEFSPDATFWQSYLGSGDENELGAIEQYLNTMYSYGEQLESPNSERWHTATLNTVVEFLTPRHSFRETSSIFRILPVAMKSQKLTDSRKESICYQFFRTFLEFDDVTDVRFGFEPYQHVVRTGQPIRGPPVGPDGVPGKADESVFAYENYTPAACIHYLRLALKLAMQKPVIQRGRQVVRFTATLCRMVSSLREQLPYDESGTKGLEPSANNHSNKVGTRELRLPTNNLPHEVQKTPMGLAFQLQFFAWLHQTVNWDYPNCNAEYLLITIAEHLISMATVIAKQNRSKAMASEERTQTQKYLSTFALGMNAALPIILDPKHCCWSMPSLSGTSGDLFYTCRGRCTKYLKILTTFECFCRDGLENVDFSECEDIRSKLRKDITDFTSWIRQLSANMKCTSQRWWISAS